MTRLVIVTYNDGRIFHEYINAPTDADAVDEAVKQLRDEGHTPKEALVLAGSAAIHKCPDTSADVWEIANEAESDPVERGW